MNAILAGDIAPIAREITPAVAARLTRQQVRLMSERLSTLGAADYLSTYGREKRNGFTVYRCVISFRPGGWYVDADCALDPMGRIALLRIGLPPVSRKSPPTTVVKRLGWALVNGRRDMVVQDLSPTLKRSLTSARMKETGQSMRIRGRPSEATFIMQEVRTNGVTLCQFTLFFDQSDLPRSSCLRFPGPHVMGVCGLDQNGQIDFVSLDGVDLVDGTQPPGRVGRFLR